MKYKKRKFWTDEEIALLREVYPKYKGAKLESFFNERYLQTICKKAKELGLEKNKDAVGVGLVVERIDLHKFTDMYPYEPDYILAREFNIGIQSVKETAAKLNLTKNRLTLNPSRYWSSDRLNLLYELYEKDYSANELALIFHVSTSTINNILQKANLPKASFNQRNYGSRIRLNDKIRNQFKVGAYKKAENPFHLAREMEVSRNTISRIINGKSKHVFSNTYNRLLKFLDK